MVAPTITIFVRHSDDCKYKGDEFWKKCNCRKHLRWTQNGVQHRRKAGTRSWAEAENVKRDIEAQLSGRVSDSPQTKALDEAIKTFIQDKTNQRVSKGVLGKYDRELERFNQFCLKHSVYSVQGINSELLTKFVATWEGLYDSTLTRSKVRERLRGFLRYCYQSEWLSRIPQVSKIKVDQAPTLPLNEKQFEKLLDSVYGTLEDKTTQTKVHALLQLMKNTGLAIRDALTLKREELIFDKPKKLYRVTTSRQKTGVHVSVPVPADVANELLEVLNGNPKYVFWSGNGLQESIAKNFQKHLKKVFEAAGLYTGDHMVSHRLRDTFAVNLLEKGVPLEEVSKLLGHESIKTTERSYAKWVKSRQDRLDSLVVGTWDKKQGTHR
jgi:integrase/recombinase XerD